MISVLREAGYRVGGLFDDDPSKVGTSRLGCKILGPPEAIYEHGLSWAVLAIGANRVRREMARRLSEMQWLTLIHPRAYVHPSAQVGVGTVVMLGAVIRPGAVIGRYTLVNTGAVVGHECMIGDYVHIAGSVHMGGDSVVEEGAMVGLGTVMIPGCRVGAWSVVGAGAAVTRDIPPRVLAAGVPALVKKEVDV